MAFIRVVRTRANRYSSRRPGDTDLYLRAAFRGRSAGPLVDLLKTWSLKAWSLTKNWSLTEMDSFDINKFLGVLLGTCIFVLVMNLVAQAIFAPIVPAKPGFKIEVKEEPATGAKEAKAGNEAKADNAAKPASAEPLGKRLQNASAEKGAEVAKKCAACHTFEKGGPNRVGPNLYGIVGAPRGEGRDFNFSAAMKAKGGTWTLDELDKFLANPREYIPGTAMTFAGVPNGKDRADLLAYLHKNSDKP
jgi:cytochrome c